MNEDRAAASKKTSAVILPHDWRIRASKTTGNGNEKTAKGLAYGFGKDGSIFYFMAPLRVDELSPAIQFSMVAQGDVANQFAVPSFIIPREDLILEKGYYVIDAKLRLSPHESDAVSCGPEGLRSATSIPPALMKESRARFIHTHCRALDLMKAVKEAIAEETGAAALSRQKRNLQSVCKNPDMAGQWIRAARSKRGNGFPTNAFEFWKRIYALIFWSRVCEFRTPDLPGKRGGGWDAERAAVALNQYYRNLNSELGELEQFAKWKPYTARWLREFEVNEGLSSKPPSGQKKPTSIDFRK